MGDEKIWKDPREGKINVEDLFGFFDELLHRMLNGEQLNLGHIYLLGSRLSGKTHWVLDYLMKILLAVQKMCVSYIVRKKEKQLKKMKKQIFARLKEEYGFIVRQGIDFKGEPDNTLTFNRNHMIFQTLNDEKVKIDDGGEVGGTTWEQADYIITFFEEISQIKRPLYDNLNDTIRGNETTQKLIICASNPWDPMNWYNQMFDKYLPAIPDVLERIGYQWTIAEYTDGQNALFIRNNVSTNKNVPVASVKKLQSYKQYNQNAYNISYLGLAGVLSNTLYASSMEKMKKVDWEFINDKNVGRLKGGVDWGEGKSRFASPTTMHLGKVDDILGYQVFAELTHWNNGDGNTKLALGLSQPQQFDKIIKFFFEQWKIYKKQIVIDIDMGSQIDFHDRINERVQDHWDIHPSQIYFVPADKSMNIEDRVLTVNMGIASGLLRVDKEKCPDLYLALMSCKQIEPENETEDAKFVREAKYVHWINSGLEYGPGDYLWELSKGWSEIYQER